MLHPLVPDCYIFVGVQIGSQETDTALQLTRKATSELSNQHQYLLVMLHRLGDASGILSSP